jgi:hypothetical protein
MTFADSAEADFWDQPSSVDGWTNRDILAHLAGGNDQFVQTVLRAVTAGEIPDPALLAPDADAENAMRISERLLWPIDQLKAELLRGDDEVLSREYRLFALSIAALGRRFESCRRADEPHAWFR